ncbi:hypothetical protein NQ314_009760 [Rhamnusium bicolor]|uniref:Hydroxylysine kinase n=1 Tax=Rhamnusium bicolor TaxID=1586634 RepID=A0AAV8XWR9_9CUCU|nr:hypothetical protein NQ314_009760 [Rhamnusium bicolor]
MDHSLFKMENILQPGVSIKPNASVQDRLLNFNGYDDKNYHVIVESKNNNSGSICDDGYVLKFINSLDSKRPQTYEAQNALLLHLGAKGVTCSKPILTKAGIYFSKVKLSSGEHIVRLLEFINGTIFYQVQNTPSLLFQAGAFVAKIDTALKDFHHPAYDTHISLWMLESLPKLPQFLFAIPNEERRKLVLEVIHEFEERVLSISNTLERGMIHGDFNEQNIIVQKEDDEWRIKAVIDFGDSHIACYLYELAIAMTYMIVEAKDIDAGGYVLAGYLSVRELPEREYRLLKVCIAARLCQSLVIGAYSNLQDPTNTYVMRTAAHGWMILEKIWAEPECKLLEKWKSTVFSENMKLQK